VAPGGGGRSRQAIAAETMASEAASAWQCGQFCQAVVVDFVIILRCLAPGGTCPPPGGLEADSA